MPAIADGRPGAVWFTLGVLLLFLLGQAVRLIGVIGLVRSPLNGDVAGWWAAGVVLGGFGVTYLLAHPGLSQQWFAFNVVSVATALTTAVVATSLRPACWRRVRWLALAALLLGVVVAALLIGPGYEPSGRRPVPPLGDRLLPYLVLVLVVTVGLAAVLVAQPEGGPARRATFLVLATSFVVGTSLPVSSYWLRDGAVQPITKNPAAVVSRDRQEAALWVAANAEPGAILVSNVFCRPVRYRRDCDHSGTWVGALTGRQIVLDGWFYIPQTLEKYDGRRYGQTLPTPFPDRLRDSLAVIERGSRSAACRLRRDHGADWIFADLGATPVSRKLASFASRQFANDEVVVYRIEPARLSCP